MEATKGKICVTGASGFLGSWVVQVLLSNNYNVHATVRELSDEKCARLKKLENASENLKTFKADLLDYESLCSAIEGCDGVFHVASPVPSIVVPNPEVILEPAVKGTLNVLRASKEAKVKRVVVVSSAVAVCMIANTTESQVMDESFWSDKEYLNSTKNWYCLSKTEAESQAIEYANQSGIDLITVCPTLILGPVLQATLNSTSKFLLRHLKGCDSMENRNGLDVVDVRDVAAALLLLYEKLEAKGRYICCVQRVNTRELVEKLKSLYPNYSYPQRFTEFETKLPLLSSEKLEKLGWTHRSLEETLVDSVESFREAGFLD